MLSSQEMDKAGNAAALAHVVHNNNNIIIYTFLSCHKVVTSQAISLVSVTMSQLKRMSFQPRFKNSERDLQVLY